MSVTNRSLLQVQLSLVEEKDLRRVFNYLANFARRQALAKGIFTNTERVATLREASGPSEGGDGLPEEAGTPRTPSAADASGAGQDDSAAAASAAGSGVEAARAARAANMVTEMVNTQATLAALKKEKMALADDALKKVTARDLDQALRVLGYTCTKKQLEYMVWEVDEDLDSAVDWDEFRLMYWRNVNDGTSLEPFELFNIVQFMTYDTDFKGHITEDDTMSTLFARYGREQVETQMRKLFGINLKANGGDGVLSLREYLDVVSVRKPKPRARHKGTVAVSPV